MENQKNQVFEVFYLIYRAKYSIEEPGWVAIVAPFCPTMKMPQTASDLA
jgi:hypothetical protein